MPLPPWIALYFLQLLLWLWLGWWGGASKAQGTLLERWLFPHRLAARGGGPLRLWAWLAVPASTVWFVLGLLDQTIRRHLWFGS
jgi:hypothetical protein